MLSLLLFCGLMIQNTKVFQNSACLGVSEMTYPYVAEKDRQNQIKNGFLQVMPDMNVAQVQSIIGKPDEVLPLINGMVRGRQIGTTHWYYIEIQAKRDYSNSKVVRVSFNQNGKVTKVDHWGFD